MATGRSRMCDKFGTVQPRVKFFREIEPITTSRWPSRRNCSTRCPIEYKADGATDVRRRLSRVKPLTRHRCDPRSARQSTPAHPRLEIEVGDGSEQAPTRPHPQADELSADSLRAFLPQCVRSSTESRLEPPISSRMNLTTQRVLLREATKAIVTANRINPSGKPRGKAKADVYARLAQLSDAGPAAIFMDDGDPDRKLTGKEVARVLLDDAEFHQYVADTNSPEGRSIDDDIEERDRLLLVIAQMPGERLSPDEQTAIGDRRWIHAAIIAAEGVPYARARNAAFVSSRRSTAARQRPFQSNYCARSGVSLSEPANRSNSRHERSRVRPSRSKGSRRRSSSERLPHGGRPLA